jgi:hypothetical protein
MEFMRNFQQIKVLTPKILKNGRKMTEKWSKEYKPKNTENFSNNAGKGVPFM